MKRSCFFLSVLLLTSLIVQAQSRTFLQDVKRDIILPEGITSPVVQLLKGNEEVLVITSKEIIRYQKGKAKVNRFEKSWITAALAPDGKLWLASRNSVQQENSSTVLNIPLAVTDSITCLFWENGSTLHIGTTAGLYARIGTGKLTESLSKRRINAITKDALNNLWIATSVGLWKRQGTRWFDLDKSLMSNGNEGKYYSLLAVNAGKDILFSAPWSVACIAGNGDHWVKRGVDGLPYGPVTHISQEYGHTWMGTNKGVIKLDDSWHYYAGKRWLLDDKVNCLLEVDANRIWVATPGGISEISHEVMTLEQKADSIEKVIEARHNRLGLINHSKLKKEGDLSTSYTENEDNDGLWTACYFAAECFRYSVTKSDDAKAKAVRTFEALERLEQVSGISGYPARSYALGKDNVRQSRSPHPKNWHFSADSSWQWLDDTSSDEITGHLFTLPLFFDLVADDDQKKRVKDLVLRIVDHVLDNNYHLIDFDGKPTRWGIWHPDSLNNSPNWMYERGLNSLQLLSFLKTARYFSDAAKYKDAYRLLVDKHGYLSNAVQAKMVEPYEVSHSDDILNFFPYYNVLKYGKNDSDRTEYLRSLDRSWRAVRSDRMPVWNVFASALLERDCDLKIAREEIEQYPIDLINWTMENAHRWDLQLDQLVSRSKQKQTVVAIPSGESGVSRWNTNPKHLSAGDGGKTEESGTYYLMAYWIGRYHGFWK
jgi:hypothetical protein